MSAPEIRFPNIGPNGLHINKLSPDAFSLFGLDIKWYGIIVCAAIFTGLLVGLREARKSGQDTDLYFNYFFYAVVSAILGARAYYVIFSWDEYRHDLIKVFAFREGGLAIYGAIIAITAAAVIFTKVKKYNFWLFADTGVFGLMIGQAIGRYGNFFNREAFGGYTSSLLAMQYRLDTVHMGVTENIRANLAEYGGAKYIQVHPAFLYESIWSVILFIGLQFYKKHKAFDGEVFLLYLFGYGFGRFWIEGLRTDQLKFFGTNVAVSQALSAALVVFAASTIVIKRVLKKKRERDNTVKIFEE